MDYRDDGCDIHHACLSCPLPACRYDRPADGSRVAAAWSRAQIRERFYAGRQTGVSLAAEMGVSRRTVYRALAERSAQ